MNYLTCVSQKQNTLEALYAMVCICAYQAYREGERQLKDYSLFYETESRFLCRTEFKGSNPLQENSQRK